MIQFKKAVPVDGFEWRSDLVVLNLSGNPVSMATGPFLVAKGDRGRMTSPLELREPHLYEAFAALESDDPEEMSRRILRFANRYGDLGQHLQLVTPNVESSQTLRGEDLYVWRQAIHELSTAFRIRRQIRNRRLDRLPLSVHASGKSLFVTWDEVQEFDASKLTLRNPRWAAYDMEEVEFLPGDVIGLANYALQKLINDNLYPHVSVRVLRDEGFNLQGSLVPDSMLAAIWYQMYQDVVGETEFIECEVCGGLIEKLPGGRSTKRVHTRCAKQRSAKRSTSLANEKL